ncbi:hypothetical protein L3X38_033015 [Prunus dulcis]|uniref:Transposable element protein n=1 Tax=Prunus dulcis TaxID=3755 RepID=A0AAD4VHI0_PRUDU|nr:hypothetical protein L3X38_033015 [Prunus dulcis]
MALETSTWIMDSGASRHICNTLPSLTDHRKLSKGKIMLRVGNGTYISAKAVGTFHLKLPHGKTLELKECLYLPGCIKNLVSVSALLNEDYTATFNRMGCSLQQGNQIICKCTMIDGLYQIQIVENSNCLIEILGPKRPREELNPTQVLHLKLGHIGQDRIQRMVKQGYLESLGSVAMPTCEYCLQGYRGSDFESDVNYRKSTSGYVFTLNEGAINGRCCKQTTTADSTTEAEYIAASEAAKEAIWIKKFITELEVVPSIQSPVILYCDNNGL